MRLLITAGPTREPIDAVRFISNRSSGRLGLDLAQAGADRGHAVTLLMGTGACVTHEPPGTLIRFESTAELESLLREHFPRCDVLVMAAAVADYRPAKQVAGKIERSRDKPMVLELEPTPDLVAGLSPGKRADQRIVAFALEERGVMLERATAKMKRKGVDAIVANPLGTMESGEIEATWLRADGASATPGRMDKQAFARWLMERMERDLP